MKETASFRTARRRPANVDNDRYSFACTWGDYNSDGWPDLYVANDFGRNSLYRNNGDGTFATVSGEAHVEEAGAGMSACWLDFDNDGNQDIYAAGMWVAAGMRVFGDSPIFTAKNRKRFARFTVAHGRQFAVPKHGQRPIPECGHASRG